MAGNANYWKNLNVGDNYDQIDQNTNGMLSAFNKVSQGVTPPASVPTNQGFDPLQGVSDKLSQIITGVDPSIQRAQIAQQRNAELQREMQAHPTGAAIAAGITGAGQGFTGGAQDAALKNLAPASYDINQQLQQANPIPTAIGKIGGTILGLTLPVANVVKGITTGGKIGAAFINAGVNALPPAIAQGLTNGDWGKAAETLGISTGIGGALSSAGAIFSGLMQKLHPELNSINAASYGLASRDYAKPEAGFASKMGLNPTTYKANTAEQDVAKSLALLEEHGGRGTAGLKKATEWFNNNFKTINDTMSSSGATLSGAAPDIINSPEFQTMQKVYNTSENPTAVQGAVSSLIAGVDKRLQSGDPKGWTDAWHFLNDRMQLGIKLRQNAVANKLEDVTNLSDQGGLLQDAASLVKLHFHQLTSNIMEQAKAAGSNVPFNFDDFMKTYSSYPVLQQAISRRAGHVAGMMGPGSETGATLGTLGGMIGDLGTNPAKAAVKVLGATALGPLVRKGVANVVNQVSGRSAEALGKLGQNTGTIGNRLSRLIGTVGAETNEPSEDTMPGISQDTAPDNVQPSSSPTNPALTQAGTPAPLPTGIDVSSLQGRNGPSSASPVPIADVALKPPQTPNPDHQNMVNAIFNKQQDLSPQQNQNVSKALSPFKQQAMENLKEQYDNWQNPMKQPWDIFLRDMLQRTNNFDPINPNTAKIISGADYERYLRTAQTVTQLQTLPQDLTSFMNPAWGSKTGSLLSMATGGQSEKYDRLVKTLYTAMTGDMKDPPEATRKQIAQKLLDWKRSGITSQGKLLQAMQSEYGLDIDTMAKYHYGE